MKRKIIATLSILALCVGCTPKTASSTENKDAKATPATEMKSDSKKDLKEGTYKEMGEGEYYISTPGGTSEGGKVPVLFANKDMLVQIGVNSQKADGSKLTYIYVDGKRVDKKQMGTMQGSINLKGDLLSVGKHKVEFVQFKEEENSEVVTYKVAEYEVKQK